jgi:hypothetical protein
MCIRGVPAWLGRLKAAALVRPTPAVSRFNLDLKKFLKGLPKYYIQKTI